MEEMEQKHEEAEVVTTATSTKAATPWMAYVIAVIAFVAIIAGVVYLMERDGRLATGIFVPSGEIAPNATIAVVNDTKIKGSELATSIGQITISANQQGIDITDLVVQQNIRDQAVNMLVNTALLKEDAAERGIVITEEDVQTRIDALVQEVGGQEALDERMTALQIDEATLRRDVKTELIIQTLLDQVFADAGISVSEDEINEFYENAGGAEAGLPPLAEVYDQVEAQVRSGKEQATLDAFIAELRADATITIN